MITDCSDNVFLRPILARSQQYPDTVAIVVNRDGDWESYTLAEFVKRVQQFYSLFATSGVNRGGILLIIMPQGVDGMAAFIASMIYGCIPSFLPPPSPKQDPHIYWDQHNKVLKRTNPVAILSESETYVALQRSAFGEGSNVALLDAGSVDSYESAVVPDCLPGSDSIALLQHSSGTTGLKKGVSLTYKSIASQLDSYHKAIGLDTPDCTVVSWLPLYHDMGLITSFLLPLWAGTPVVMIDPFIWVSAPHLLFEAVERYAGTHVWLPNFALLHLVRRTRAEENWDLGSLRALICCSEPCKPDAFDAFFKRFSSMGLTEATLQTCYAMAETVYAVSQSTLRKPVRRIAIDRECVERGGVVREAAFDDGAALVLLSNGSPIQGCSVGILLGDAFVGERVVGEICVSGDFLFTGYFEDPATTDNAFFDTWYRTGDIGFLDQQEIFVVGRRKEIAIINGKNVYVHDIEEIVSRVAGVRPGRCVAFGQYVINVGSEHLVVIAEPDANVTPSEDLSMLINRAVVEELGIGCGDIRLVEPGWLIKTTSGKMSRSENKRRYENLFLRGKLPV